MDLFDYRSVVGIEADMKDIYGYADLSDKAQELLRYLYAYHRNELDGFIHAKQLSYIIGLGMDTRTLRKLCAEIDYKTELVVYASNYGYKLAGSNKEMEEAIKFALAPAKSAIRRVFAKNKKETLHWLHGFIGNLEKEFGGNVSGQLQVDDNMELREVDHIPPRKEGDYEAPKSVFKK